MREILLAISFLALELGEQHQFLTSSQLQHRWLGVEPAKPEEIQKTEKRLNIQLPEDYKNFLKITNGFSAPNSIEPTFLNVNEIDYLKNIDKLTIEAYKLPALEDCILVAGKDEEQYFLLIPPKNENEKWRYWKFANWYPGEVEFENLETYFRDALSFMEKEYEENK